MMVTFPIVLVIFLSYVTTVNGEDQFQARRSRGLWHRITEKLIEKYSIDDRHFDDEGMLLFPDVGFQSLNDSNTWKTIVHGWRYRNGNKKDWLGFSASVWIERLARNLLNENGLSYLNATINRDRLRPFFAKDDANEMITINIANQTQIIQTDESGQFYEEIEISNSDIQSLKRQETGAGNVITYATVDDDGENSTGIIRLIEPREGLSVISDIDDTIKVSQVLDKVRLLANTFIYPFKSVPGMSDLYRQWQAKYVNCTFHYLSGMPDQLYTLTQEFINTNHFPDGSFHMRHFGWASGSLFEFLHSQSTFLHKMRYLYFFFSNTKRDYILIGDSGEKDPEIYGTITREHPDRVRAIFIRAIKGEAFNDQRFVDAFQGIPDEKWLIFNDPKQVPIDLSRAPRAIVE